MARVDKENYYLNIADSVLERSTCIRRKYGAIIVQNDELVSSGYNGAPRGRENCTDLGFCLRESLNIPSGSNYELCRSVHAEANAIISARRSDMLGATMYLVGRDSKTGELITDATPCAMCRRFIINSGIKRVISRSGEDSYTVTNVRDWVFDDDSLIGIPDNVK